MYSAGPKFRPNFVYVCVDLRDPTAHTFLKWLSKALTDKGYVVSTTPIDGLPDPEISVGDDQLVGEAKIEEFVKSLETIPHDLSTRIHAG